MSALMRCDQSPDAGDLLVGGGGVGAGPVVDPVDGGGQPFPGAQQIVEVCLQVGQERDVGAEVIAAGAAEPDRAGSAAGFDVGWFGAGAVGDGDLADGVAGAFGFQQQARITPDPVAVPVETERGDGVDGGAATVLADAVVAAGHRIAAVIEQFGQHVDRDTGIGVTLGIAVPVDVGHDLGLVDLDPVAGAQDGQGRDPLAVPGVEHIDADRRAPVGITAWRGQQRQFSDRGVGEHRADPLLLVGDHGGGGLADRQTPTEAVGLGVVVDEDRRSVLVAVQAVQGQGEDVFWPSPGVDADLGGDPHLDWFEGVEVGAQDGHDLRRHVAAGFAAFGFGGDVAAFDGEIAGQPGCCLARPGQAEGADAGQHLAHVTADAVAPVSADLADRLQVGQPVEEVLDVVAAQRRSDESTIGSAVEELRQQAQRVDLAADPGGAAASVTRELFCRPPFGGLGQPGLADSGERQVPAMAEDREIPGVLGLFAPGIGQGPPDVLGQGGPQGAHGFVAGDLGPVGGDRGDLSRRSPSHSARNCASVIFAPPRTRC